jgi:hypothetical protein
MIKVSTFLSETEFGRAAVPLFGPADSFFEKTASASLLSEVTKYIATLKPKNGSQYVLVNALGAGEYFGSNINGDHFPEAALIHKPNDWKGVPLLDRRHGKTWAYGFPTFYDAHPYAHHKNKDSSRAYGEVELAAWNDRMKRVELVTRIDHDKCVKFGGMSIWDRLKEGQFPDVSMGSRVPYDTCSITLDKKLYQEALSTFDPSRHKHPGMAALEFHKKLKEKGGAGIRGLAITRADYSRYCLEQMNKILPDGRKVFVYNDYPRFFDISYVFIGADRTAKVMVFISQNFSLSSSAEAEKLGYAQEGAEKTASIAAHVVEAAFKTAALGKSGEIDKQVSPNLPPSKAVPLLARSEPRLSSSVMGALSSVPLGSALSTTAGMGIILKPREFLNLVLSKMGKVDLASALERRNILFPSVCEELPADLSVKDFMPALARKLLPAMESRSALGPIIQHRLVIIAGAPPVETEKASSLSDDLLRNMGAAYNGYRRGVEDFVRNTQDLIKQAAGSQTELCKLASASADEVLPPLSVHYIATAFKDELTSASELSASSIIGASVQRDTPSRNTWM